MRTGLLVFQTLTFVALGLLLVTTGEAALGVAQLLIAAVNVLVYA